MASQMFVLFLGRGDKAFIFLYLNVTRTMAVISNCVTVIKEPIRAVSFGGSFGKASKTGARTVAPTAKWILNAVCAALILSTIRISTSSTLYKNDPGKKRCYIKQFIKAVYIKQQITHYDSFCSTIIAAIILVVMTIMVVAIVTINYNHEDFKAQSKRIRNKTNISSPNHSDFIRVVR